MRRKLVIVGAVVVLVGGAITGSVLAWGSSGTLPAADPGLPPAAAKVTRTTLAETIRVSGTLSYGEPVEIRALEPGVLTWLAPVGSTVTRGEPLFKLAEHPDIVLYGPLPLYRTLREGVTGADVRELKRNLARLGYAGLSADGTYTAATASAVRAWQADAGLPQTGTVELGQVLFTPGPVRVAVQLAQPGDAITGGTDAGNHPIIGYTGITRAVTVQLEVADQALAAKGRTVTIRVPGQGTVTGTISEIRTVVTSSNSAAAESGSTSDGSGPPAPAGPGPSASTVRLEVTVTIADQKALGSLDTAPVDVEFVSAKRADVLAVPVVALLALPAGGFGVQVVDGATTHIVPVRTGMFAAGQVEISGNGIAEGVTVGVPK